jgi:putative nucleotidyltransferase with HDIG domain
VSEQHEDHIEVSDDEFERVLSALPELLQINDSDLRRRVVAAFVLGLRDSSFKDIRDVPGEYDLDASIGLVAHSRIVTCMVLAAAEALTAQVPDVAFDRDILIAGALVHDVGKIYEYDLERATAWQSHKDRTGYPAVRHPVYGAHLATMAGLPEPVIHIVANHAAEGQRVRRSLEATLVATLDHISWELLLIARRGLTIEDVRSASPRVRPLPPSRQETTHDPN